MFMKLSLVLCNLIVILNLFVDLSCAVHGDIYKNSRLGTRTVETKFGLLQGLVLPLDNYKFLKPVEAFLAVPYATPPTRNNR